MPTYIRFVVTAALPRTAPRTRLALLATIGDLHGAVVGYDLAHLRALVEELEPDLLGVEGDAETWARSERSSLPPEIRGALVPAARRTDTVIVPLGASSPLELAPPEGARLRSDLIHVAEQLSTTLQRAAGTADRINHSLVIHVCGALCTLETWAASDAGRRGWEETNERLLANLLAAVRRDPGRRVLAAVHCRRVHWLAGRLSAYAGEMELVGYRDL